MVGQDLMLILGWWVSVLYDGEGDGAVVGAGGGAGGCVECEQPVHLGGTVGGRARRPVLRRGAEAGAGAGTVARARVERGDAGGTVGEGHGAGVGAGAGGVDQGAVGET